MNYFNKKNIIIIVIVVLLVVNISTISTVIYLSYRKPAMQEMPMEQVRSERASRYLQKELKLDTSQYENIREMGIEYRHSSSEILRTLNASRREMVDLMSVNEPDTAELYVLAERIGDLHQQLKKNTIDHYLRMKEECSPEQFKKLSKMFQGMVMENEIKSEKRWGRRSQDRRNGRPKHENKRNRN